MQQVLKALLPVVLVIGLVIGVRVFLKGKAQKAVIDAKSELPKMVSELTDEKAKRKAEIAYRTQMQELLRAFLDVETALINDDAKKAEKALRAADNLKSTGHGQFRPRDGK